MSKLEISRGVLCTTPVYTSSPGTKGGMGACTVVPQQCTCPPTDVALSLDGASSHQREKETCPGLQECKLGPLVISQDNGLNKLVQLWEEFFSSVQ